MTGKAKDWFSREERNDANTKGNDEIEQRCRLRTEVLNGELALQFEFLREVLAGQGHQTGSFGQREPSLPEESRGELGKLP
jgi:hypothetical protein